MSVQAVRTMCERGSEIVFVTIVLRFGESIYICDHKKKLQMKRCEHEEILNEYMRA